VTDTVWQTNYKRPEFKRASMVHNPKSNPNENLSRDFTVSRVHCPN